jgi:hypothetical protein
VVEYLVANETVVGSNPTTRSKFGPSVVDAHWSVEPVERVRSLKLVPYLSTLRPLVEKGLIDEAYGRVVCLNMVSGTASGNIVLICGLRFHIILFL